MNFGVIKDFFRDEMISKENDVKSLKFLKVFYLILINMNSGTSPLTILIHT